MMEGLLKGRSGKAPASDDMPAGSMGANDGVNLDAVQRALMDPHAGGEYSSPDLSGTFITAPTTSDANAYVAHESLGMSHRTIPPKVQEILNKAKNKNKAT